SISTSPRNTRFSSALRRCSHPTAPSTPGIRRASSTPRTCSGWSGAPCIDRWAERMQEEAPGARRGNVRTHLCIGASTGGTEAVKVVLQALPPWAPPVLIVQDMPELFTVTFARRLSSICAIRVKEAEDGERLCRGTAYIAPGH